MDVDIDCLELVGFDIGNGAISISQGFRKALWLRYQVHNIKKRSGLAFIKVQKSFHLI